MSLSLLSIFQQSFYYPSPNYKLNIVFNTLFSYNSTSRFFFFFSKKKKLYFTTLAVRSLLPWVRRAKVKQAVGKETRHQENSGNGYGKRGALFLRCRFASCLESDRVPDSLFRPSSVFVVSWRVNHISPTIISFGPWNIHICCQTPSLHGIIGAAKGE